MKLTMIYGTHAASPAVETAGGELVDLGAPAVISLLAGKVFHTVRDILCAPEAERDRLRRLIDGINADERGILERLRSTRALREAASARFAPILTPRMILCGGMAYREHMKEMNVAPPSAPTAFMKAPSSVTSHREPIVLPRQEPEMIDFECELSCVIGSPLHDAAPDEALKCVAGYTMVNDVGSRRMVSPWLASMKGQEPMKCVGLQNLALLDKQFPTFCPMGPYVVTADEFGDPGDATVETRLNGQVMQSAHTSDLIFPVAYSLSYFSKWYRLEPGDVFTTGSPSGVGFAQNPPRFLRAGDLIEVSGSKIGTLSNPVVHSD
jgi:2-keto-4-pentenoate hydratase/2-oxohepta-3-ene-1,7-dioic acid hydratase in catechol pathway